MHVVAAGVADAVGLRGEVEAGLLPDRQGVDVGAQRDAVRRVWSRRGRRRARCRAAGARRCRRARGARRRAPSCAPRRARAPDACAGRDGSRRAPQRAARRFGRWPRRAAARSGRSRARESSERMGASPRAPGGSTSTGRRSRGHAWSRSHAPRRRSVADAVRAVVGLVDRALPFTTVTCAGLPRDRLVARRAWRTCAPARTRSSRGARRCARRWSSATASPVPAARARRLRAPVGCEVAATPIAYAASLGPWLLVPSGAGLGFRARPGPEPAPARRRPGRDVAGGRTTTRRAGWNAARGIPRRSSRRS